MKGFRSPHPLNPPLPEGEGEGKQGTGGWRLIVRGIMKKTIEENRTTSSGLLRYANDYLKAYEIIRVDSSFKWPAEVPAYLFCHGLELSFKAFLRTKGKTIKELMKLGHNLNEIVKECKKLNGDKINVFNEDDWNYISLLNQQYNNKSAIILVLGIGVFQYSSDKLSDHSNVQIT